MNNKLKKTVTTILLTLFFITLFNTQKVEAADVTAQDLMGSWDARLKINKLEVFGTMQKQKDAAYKQEQEPQKVTFSMHEGKLAVSFGSVPVPISLSGGKISGTEAVSVGFFPINEMILEGTVKKTANGIDFTINTWGEAFNKDRKNGWIYSYTYTNAPASAEPSASKPPAAEEPAEVEEQAVEEVIPVELITIEPGLFRLKVGAQRQLNVKIKPPGANAADVIVKSYDSNVIDIYDNAVVKGLNVGYSEIVAATRDGKVTATSRVFVGDEKEVVGLVLGNIWSKTKEFLAGESFQVKTPTATCGVRG